MECYLGMVLLFAGNYAPEGFALCDGRQLTIRENQALFAVIGTEYGGDNQTYFNLPKLQAPSDHLHYIICINGLYPQRTD